MYGYQMIVPNFERKTRTHFVEWLDRLQHSSICAEVYRNSTYDTADLLERAHGYNSMFIVEVSHTGSYLIGAEERTEFIKTRHENCHPAPIGAGEPFRVADERRTPLTMHKNLTI